MKTSPEPPGSIRGRVMVVVGDITDQEVDAIVNPANPSLLGGGGADGAIHRAAGPALREECRTLGGCRTGEAKITGGYRLPARFVIHTVGPVWHGGSGGEDGLLAGCYRSCLALAKEKRLSSIAFPAISTGAYRFPFERAARIAVATVLETLPETPSLRQVILVCHEEAAAAIYRRILSGMLPPENHDQGGHGDVPDGDREVPDHGVHDRIEAHLMTIESAYGIRISNFSDVMDRIAGATPDDREILAIATAISTYVAAQPPEPGVEISSTFLDQVIRRFAGRPKDDPRA
jgi:O-acetyl-ADP-ribose deacetylase (regulator of RNase III)